MLYYCGMSALLHAVLNIFFPPTCIGCGMILHVPNSLVYNDPYNPTICESCCNRLYLHAPHPDVVLQYENPLAHSLIHALKFGGVRGAAAPLGFSLAARMHASGYNVATTVLIPVPLGKKRLLARGYNQAALIASAASRSTHIPILANALRRSRDTTPQTSVANKEERKTNVAGCFCVTATPPAIVTTIILIDDVMTSGATLAEAARAIRTSFYGEVHCMAACHA